MLSLIYNACLLFVLQVCRFYLVDLACLLEGFLPWLKCLVVAGCDLDGKQREDKSCVPLMITLYNHNLPAAQFLIQQNVDVNISSLTGDRRPLWTSIVTNLSDFVELFLSVSEIDLNIRRSRGYPLLRYCYRNSSEFFEKLLQAGADPNIVDNHLSSPLMISVTRASLDTVKTLIRYGADVNQKNRRNETPLIVGVYGGMSSFI